MAAPSAGQIQNWTDRIAALLALDLAGFRSELVSAASQPLSVQVDAAGDQALEAALMGLSLAIDRQSLPERYYSALPSLFSRYRDWINGLNAFLPTDDGGGYANLRALLAARSATVHPLFAEAARNAGLSFSDSDGDVTTVFAPNYQTRAPDRVYTGADGALADDTTDAGSAGTADVALFATNGHSLYVGSRHKFSQIILALSTLANVTIAPTVSYWNGNAWTALTPTDNAVGFTRNDNLKWAIPSDWVRSNADAGGTALTDLSPLYYIKITRTASVLGTPPVGTSLRIIPAPVLTGAAGSSHLGVDQPPLALVRITGVNTCVVEPLITVDYARFKEPGLRARALTPIGADQTLTLAYVDQAGNDDSKAQSAWGGVAAALDTAALALNTGDTGARSIRTACTIVTTATQGVLEIYAPEARTPAL